MYTPSLAESVYFSCVAAVVQNKILATSYTPPEVLTKAEWQVVADAAEGPAAVVRCQVKTCATSWGIQHNP